MLGKQDNCQVAVSVSLACDQGSVPVAWQLYLPEDWAADPKRRVQAGVPEALRFATKTQIALAQLRTLLAEGAPHHCVLADAGYGVDTAFRQACPCRRTRSKRSVGARARMSRSAGASPRCVCVTPVATPARLGCAPCSGC